MQSQHADEIWRDVEGFEDSYQVSNTGRVWRKPYTVEYYEQRRDCTISKQYNGHEMTPQDNGNGYLQVPLRMADGKQKQFLAHRLVLFHFGPDRPTENHVVNHIDGDKTNNHVSNLEWVTQTENILHGHVLRSVRENGKEQTLQTVRGWASDIENRLSNGTSEPTEDTNRHDWW